MSNYVRLFRVPPESKLQDAEDIINRACTALKETPVATSLVTTSNVTIFISVITTDNPTDSKGKIVQAQIKEKRQD